jgi:hypothetical protein
MHHFTHTDPRTPLWWSRAKDFGLLEWLRIALPKPVGQRNETLVNVVARKPLEHVRE